MYRQTTLWLVLIVALLCVAVWWQSGREESGAFETSEALFEDLQGARITSFRVDNVERGLTLKLERDSAGVWYITDPLAYPAEAGVVQLLLDAVTRNRCTRIPPDEAGEADYRKLGFDPPRVVIEVTETLPDGERTQQVELGEVDLDGGRVIVRVRGELMRTGRNLDTCVKRDLHEYRSHRIFRFPAETVTQFARTGLITLEPRGPEYDIGLVALREEGRWRAHQPAQATLDPTLAQIFVRGLIGIQVMAFVNDDLSDPQDPAFMEGLARFGLDRPAMRIAISIASGEEFELQFGRPGFDDGWYAKRDGSPHVWRIEDRDFLRAAMPFEEMLDRQLVRTLREDVKTVSWESEGRAVELRRGPRGGWHVAERADANGGEPDVVFVADEGGVTDLLGQIEQTEFTGFALAETFAPAEGAEVLLIETTSGLQGGRFGRVHVDADSGSTGNNLRQFRRRGDDVVALIDADLIEITRMRAEDLRSLQLLQLNELRQESMTLARPGHGERVYQRDRRGLWVEQGKQHEATELFEVWDAILNLRASEHLRESAGELFDVITVEFLDQRGQRVLFTLGRLAGTDGHGDGGKAVAEIEGRRSVLANQDLHRSLLDRFGD